MIVIFLNILQILTVILGFEYPIAVKARPEVRFDRYRITEKRKKLDELSGLVNNWSRTSRLLLFLSEQRRAVPPQLP
ncbi:MAG: hypothetical protein EBE86_006160 [Hormoscilla sp. GUM202]|nr:hypothetical protein [Hormoscilla sp. GUM202]